MPQKRLSMPAWGWEPHRACESLDCNFTSFSDHSEGDICVDKAACASTSSAAKPRALELLPDVPRCGFARRIVVIAACKDIWRWRAIADSTSS